MNILNEMDHSANEIENNEYTASLNINYNIARGLQFNTTLSYTGGNADEKLGMMRKPTGPNRYGLLRWILRPDNSYPRTIRFHSGRVAAANG